MSQIQENLTRLGSAEIVKRIRAQINKEFPNCTFSITQEHYSGGWSVDISLMKADFKVIRDMSEISDLAIFRLQQNNRYTRADIEKFQLGNYHQLNQYQLREYEADSWNNGVFLTEKAHSVLKRVVEITNQYNWDNSDSQIDHFDVNFYLELQIGKWNKPFERVNTT